MPSDVLNPSAPREPRATQRHVVAPLAETPLQEVDAVDPNATPRSLWGEAWHNLVRNPVFVISALLILFVLFVVAFPGVFTSLDPTHATISQANKAASDAHLLGTDRLGYDVFARTVYGARTSVSVGFFAMILSTLIGSTIGAFAGYIGGWFDEVLSRVTDIFFAIPLVLGAIVFANRFAGHMNLWTVVLVLSIFGWTSVARIMRGSVISIKNQDFVTASTALGAGRFTNLLRHVIPNAIAPVIVTATVNLGVFIVAESTLSFLGVGITNVVSWGADLSSAKDAMRTLSNNPYILFAPSIALAITVLSFIMLGDAVRDALDPKARKR
ncbi:ABC transporter permease [Brachybacterium huguangmaarense]|uniref:ABC transporter permease n=1 Tax=Brachybacterium huguangmaarense TaxID=1652028 RepID=A0ABY6G2E5_9MICO|nr:ABC transporter permease [Brachybacterium huguangmaarense]UYG16834.1 ABC transporter permease [Brachybacterium huguangmaarense]